MISPAYLHRLRASSFLFSSFFSSFSLPFSFSFFSPPVISRARERTASIRLLYSRSMENSFGGGEQFRIPVRFSVALNGHRMSHRFPFPALTEFPHLARGSKKKKKKEENDVRVGRARCVPKDNPIIPRSRRSRVKRDTHARMNVLLFLREAILPVY